MSFKPVKKTTFLEAVAAAIQHEKDLFEFYSRHSETLPEGPIKKLFFQLAEDIDEHIALIGDIYSQVKGGEALPNLKLTSTVQKFHMTSLNLLMRRLDRNKDQKPTSDGLEALRLAHQEHDDAAEFYEKMADKFEDPGIKYLFQRLANFQEENRMLLESYTAYTAQGDMQPSFYWEEEA